MIPLILILFALFVISFLKTEPGKMTSMGAGMGLLTLLGSLFVGGGLIFLAIAGRFL